MLQALRFYRHLVRCAVCATALLAPHALGAQAQWRLVEEWRVGGDVTGAHSFLDVRSLARLPNGGIVLLEAKDQQVHFLDARGRPVRSVGRVGAGPGEFQNARGLVVLPSGALIVNDADNNRFTVLSTTGDLVRSVPVSQSRSFGGYWDAWVTRQGQLVEAVSLWDRPRDRRAREIWDADLARSRTVPPPDCPVPPQPPSERLWYEFGSNSGGMSMPIPFVMPRLWYVEQADGSEWRARWPDFSVITHRSADACAPDVTISLAGPRVAVPRTVRDSAATLVSEAARRYAPPGPDLDLIPKVYPPFDALRLDEGGRLWVARQTTPTQFRFEVYSRTGAPIATLPLPPRFEPLRPMILTTDHLLGFLYDENDLLHLAAFRIVK